MATVRGNFYIQAGAVVAALPEMEGGEVVFNPAGFQTGRTPVVWIRNIGDQPDGSEDGRLRGVTRRIGRVPAAALLRMVVNEPGVSGAVGAEDLAEAVINGIHGAMLAFKAMTPAVHIQQLKIVEDPDFSLQNENAAVITVRCDYFGGC